MSPGWQVSANDIKYWTETNKKESESLLPGLVRRLIVASIPQDKIKQIDFPEDVSTTGFDGFLETESGCSFVLCGTSVWEIGTEKDIKGKADADYKKRTDQRGEINKKKTVYYTVTSRNWRDKRKWVLEKNKEKKWKVVRGLNASDLAQWLSQCHSVNVWFSRIIGKRISGDYDIDESWDSWKTSTNPSCVSNFIIAGRNEESKKLVELLKDTLPKQIQVISQSIDESFAFILASLKENLFIAPRVLIVKTQESWDFLLTLQEKLILIPSFSKVNNINLAVEQGHTIIIPKIGVGVQTTPPGKNVIILSRPNQAELTNALIGMGFSKPDADTVVQESHGYIGPLRRHPRLHNQNPAIPEWVYDKSYRQVLLAQLFVGIWDNSKSTDCQKVADIAGVSCEELKSTLHTLSTLNDPPVIFVDNKWICLSRHDLWYLLCKFIDEPLLQRFQKITISVLTENDPSFELKPPERWKANVYQKTLNNSDEFRSGISNMIAILATYGDVDCVGLEINFQHYVDFIVRHLFDEATNQRWYSLKKCLPELAEASPEVFLESVEKSLKSPESPIITLFEPEGSLGHSGHVYLLWALECISWNPTILSKVARVFVKLSCLDPGGKSSNRPWNSLIAIFKPEFPQTTASVETRLTVIDTLLKYEQSIGWKLVISLLPELYPGFVSRITVPQYRNWAKNWIVEVSYHDYMEFSKGISERILNKIKEDPDVYWPELFSLLERMPLPCVKKIFPQLESDIPRLSKECKLTILENIRKIVHNNSRAFSRPQKYPSKIIAEFKRIFKAVEPKSPIQCNVFLFNSEYPPISSKRENIHKYLNEVEEKRRKTLEIIWRSQKLNGILKLVNSVKIPGSIGICLAQVKFSNKIENDILGWIDGRNRQKSIAARAFVYTKTSLDPHWASLKIKKAFKSWKTSKKVAFCLGLPPSRFSFELIASLDPETNKKYWKRVELPFVDQNNECVEWVIRQYLRNSRPLQATRLAGLYFRSVDIDPSLVAECLEAIATFDKQDKLVQDGSLSSDIVDLLKFLESKGEVPDIKLINIEMQFILTYYHNQITPHAILDQVHRNPSSFVNLICMAFKANPPIPGEFSGVSEKQIKNRAIGAHSILELITQIPGEENSTVNASILNNWVDNARQGCSEMNRGIIGDEYIGKILSHSPNGCDEIWPHESVREVLERCESYDIERGMVVGLRNQRGVVGRDLFEGGKQERELFIKYDGWAKQLTHTFPRTSNVLQKIAKGYSTDALEEDREVEYLRNTQNH